MSSRGPRVIFTDPSVFISKDEIEEDDVYVNAQVHTESTLPAPSDKKTLPIIKPLAKVAICWGIFLLIMALRIYYTSRYNITNLNEVNDKLSLENKHLRTDKENLTRENKDLKADKENLRRENEDLKADKENLTRENKDLKADKENLLRENEDLKEDKQNLTRENEDLKADKQNLTRDNEDLKADKQNPTRENEDLKADKQNLTRENQYLRAVNQSATAITPTQIPEWRTRWGVPFTRYRKKRETQPCQTGWLHLQSSCYAINHPDPAHQRTWEEARDDCREKNADLVVIESPEEQGFITNSTLDTSAHNGFWIGLRVDGDQWEWINGYHLTQDYWILQPANNHYCATFLTKTKGWKAVNCEVKHGWICEMDGSSL